jgi:U3 small nucleolar ribonucleoprotein protein LCP5
LLDTKTELFLSYLQNLVFIVLIKLGSLRKRPSSRDSDASDADARLSENAVKKLTELRVYLERGIRPLEGRLKYQVDKVLKAAEDAERIKQRANAGDRKSEKLAKDQTEAGHSDSDASAGSKSSGSDIEEEEVDDLVYRPNPSALSRGAQGQAKRHTATNGTDGNDIYRPPKIKPTALPVASSDRRLDRQARRARSSVIDEFVSAEMSAAPLAEPSIGTTIRAGGRRVKSQQDREKEAERITYEETNFVRLPKESRKERAKRRDNRQGGYGGEDWRGLGEGADRIERLTRRSRTSGGVLERSRKRRATDDGPRGTGANIGESFEKRRKKIAGWKR